jgi:hypothetical protein
MKQVKVQIRYQVLDQVGSKPNDYHITNESYSAELYRVLWRKQERG